MCSDYLTKNLPGAIFERHICPFVGEDECYAYKTDNKEVSKQETHSMAHKGRMLKRDVFGTILR